jgi:uncharacterized protein YjiS (DUF1127 family)
MQFKRQLPGGPPLRWFATLRAEETIAQTRLVANTGATRAGNSTALGPRLGSHLEVVDRPRADDRPVRCERGIRISPKRNALSHSILAGRSGAVMKTIGGLAARGEAAFESLLLAAMSWTIAQALAGCAEYCQAMCPPHIEPDEAVDGHDAAGGPQPDLSVGNQPGGQEIGTRESLAQSRQTRLRANFIVHAEAVHIAALARSGAKRSIKRAVLQRWRGSIMSPVAEFWLRLRQERERRRAIMELRALEHRALQDVEISRRQTEYLASLRKPDLGDHCE